MAARPIHKVLIANRGEIASRILRSCQALGLGTVAVYSEPDRLGLHVLLADEAVAIGPGPASESYLVGDRLIAAARATGADAIHPGYGFLSENAGFARKVIESGLTWIGPPPDAIFAMGLKTEARKRMLAAGVPVVPGTEGSLTDLAEARREAARIGYPLLIKARAGGGGKGMRVVEKESELASAFERAAGEALAAFGDAGCYLERYFPEAHHIEIQILSGPDGTAHSIGERECSVQRRHQKVVEECPSPFLTPEIRERMAAAARQAAAACGYVGAGTIEFLVAPDRSFYFLEMNTRLQVEHAVTELVWGVDLVEEQIRVASGLAPRGGWSPRGWAIEARVYAENPRDGFRPCPGPIRLLREPHGPFLRIDSGVYQGSEVSRFYDPMISKVTAWGPDRDGAIARLRQGLEEYVVEGVETTIPFCLEVLAHPVFRSGTYTTRFVGRDLVAATELPSCPAEVRDMALVAAALGRSRIESSRSRPGSSPVEGGALTPFQLAARRAALRGGSP